MHVIHMHPRTALISAALGLVGFGFLAGPRAAAAEPEKAVFYLGWRAEPEFGGFFQALNTGLYRQHGLDVDIRAGNPQTNAQLILSLHKADFIEGSSGDAINALQQRIPLVTVAAMFQKSPRVLIAHTHRGSDTLEQMRGKPILIGTQALTTVWPFLRAKYGYTDDQIRPYTFNEAPFLHNEDAIQEGYVTEEPFILARLGVDHPVVLLLSDYGYQEYAMAITTTREMVERRPDFVQRFVDASIAGWYSYLYQDPAPGNRYIHENNPDLSDAQIAYSVQAMRDQGMVDSGDARRLGIGAMNDERWADFYRTLVAAGVATPGLDLKRAYTLRFVNRKAGL
jgi:NitT/TauT family transport system substrate-binding protein